MWVARLTGRPIHRVLEEDAPAEFGLWRAHLRRHPPDEVPNVLFANLHKWSKPEDRPTLAEMRPHAYRPTSDRKSEPAPRSRKRSAGVAAALLGRAVK